MAGLFKGAADLLSENRNIRKLIGAPAVVGRPRPNRNFMAEARPITPLVAIGASAGGPAALAKILGYLPASFASPMVIVQHVDSQIRRSPG